MSRIREKATESEAVVRNITKDIQVLDLAKKNLILSMTTLKRLQMLGMPLKPYSGLLMKQLSPSQCGYPAGGFCEGKAICRDCPDTCSMLRLSTSLPICTHTRTGCWRNSNPLHILPFRPEGEPGLEAYPGTSRRNPSPCRC